MTISIILENRAATTITASPDMTLLDVTRIFAEKRIGAVPVVEGFKVVGIVSERDLVYCLADVGAEALDKTVGEVMTAPAITVTGNQSILGALGLMTRRRIRHLPVVEEDKLVGIVSIGDLVKYRMDRIEADASAMRDYIRQT